MVTTFRGITIPDFPLLDYMIHYFNKVSPIMGMIPNQLSSLLGLVIGILAI
uniref:Uncharacterized protein n=1 Tax=Medicago truncatula TaxID=3880 RepID=A2Q3C3_MEDTR|nr:hypothetical protein MtrDRAFT_AC155880g23v2 [Medicago truncatula]